MIERHYYKGAAKELRLHFRLLHPEQHEHVGGRVRHARELQEQVDT